MKAIEAIHRVDILEPNQYAVDQKLRWLSLLDGQIFEELINAYEPEREKPGEYITGEEELLAPMPYAESIKFNDSYDLATLYASTGPNIHNIVSGIHCVFIMFHHNQGIAQIT